MCLTCSFVFSEKTPKEVRLEEDCRWKENVYNLIVYCVENVRHFLSFNVKKQRMEEHS